MKYTLLSTNRIQMEHDCYRQGGTRAPGPDVHLELHEKILQFVFVLMVIWLLGILQTKEHNMIAERMKYRANLKLNIHDVPRMVNFDLEKKVEMHK